MAYMIMSLGGTTDVATPPMVIQGLITVCPPVTFVPASVEVSFKDKITE